VVPRVNSATERIFNLSLGGGGTAAAAGHRHRRVTYGNGGDVRPGGAGDHGEAAGRDPVSPGGRPPDPRPETCSRLRPLPSRRSWSPGRAVDVTPPGIVPGGGHKPGRRGGDGEVTIPSLTSVRRPALTLGHGPVTTPRPRRTRPTAPRTTSRCAGYAPGPARSGGSPRATCCRRRSPTWTSRSPRSWRRCGGLAGTGCAVVHLGSARVRAASRPTRRRCSARRTSSASAPPSPPGPPATPGSSPQWTVSTAAAGWSPTRSQSGCRRCGTTCPRRATWPGSTGARSAGTRTRRPCSSAAGGSS